MWNQPTIRPNGTRADRPFLHLSQMVAQDFVTPNSMVLNSATSSSSPSVERHCLLRESFLELGYFRAKGRGPICAPEALS